MNVSFDKSVPSTIRENKELDVCKTQIKQLQDKIKQLEVLREIDIDLIRAVFSLIRSWNWDWDESTPEWEAATQEWKTSYDEWLKHPELPGRPTD